MSEPEELSQQYQEVLELEQECWNFSEWCHPERNSVTPLSSAGSADDSDSSEDGKVEEVNGIEGSESPAISTATHTTMNMLELSSTVLTFAFCGQGW
jgi:hypothetical protein